MRIGQIAPLQESVPPQLYGGTERVVSYLTEELIRQGHEVVLFASGDSVTDAELDSVVTRALRLDPTCVDPIAPHLLMLERVLARASELDILHFHVDYLHFPLVRRLILPPHLTTLHGRLDMPHLQPLYDEYDDIPVSSVSLSQQRPLPQANWCASVHHGLPHDLYDFNRGPGEYFAFLGRISPEKRVDRAIAIAKQLRVPLKIAAKIDRVDTAYFESVIAPLIDDPLIELVGEIGDRDKGEFLGNARALLFPIDWPEPFGLVMIEAMACGTPVVAFSGGSVREVLTLGVSGFVVDDMPQAIAAAARVGDLDRRKCRAEFEQRFTVERMAHEYVALYTAMIEKRPHNFALGSRGTDAEAAE